jgi:hypothetical protein
VVLVRKVYISHPLRGNVEANRGRVDEICRRISDLNAAKVIEQYVRDSLVLC